MTFIVVEGGEGAGKSTQVALLAARLRAEGYAVDETREPGGTEAGAELRAKLLHGDAIDAETELAWLLEDRRLHVEQRIKPNLARRMVVVCDRFSPSTLAYQGVARGMGVDDVERRCALAAGGVEPDLVIVLDLPDDVAEARVAIDRDRFEREGADFHARVRAAYRDLAPARGWAVVDASGAPEAVAERVWAVVAPRL
jgi:dTMP kinase